MAFTSEQRRVADRALRRAQQRGATSRVQKALILAGLTESGLQHDRYSEVGSGDRDSVGFLQQRPSQGWGPAGESIERDTDQFLDRALKLNRGFSGSAGQLAQAVQRSAFPERYDEHSGEADVLLRRTGSVKRRDRSLEVAPVAVSEQLPSVVAQPGGQELAASMMAPQQPRRSVGLQAPAFSAGPVTAGVSVQSSGGPRQESPGAALAQALTAIKGLAGVRLPGAPDGAEGAVRTPAAGGPARSSGVKSRVKITGPNPGRIQPQVVQFMEAISRVRGGKPVVGSDGTGHSKYTVNGNVSQHSTGDATDVPARGKELIRMGQAALIAAGMPRAKARKQTGGLFNVNGKQIIFNTQEGGDHTDHLHVGVSRR